MSNVQTLFPQQEIQRILSDMHRRGGGGGDMTERLAVLETKMDAVQGALVRVDGRLGAVESRLGGVEVGLATLTERVAHLPSKGYAVTTALLSITVLSAVIVFGDQITALLGVQ